MISILHISDPHGQTETMCRLDALASFHPECDVLALIGDCASTIATEVPARWNEWPQRTKLAVPGNHDLPHTYQGLSSWRHEAPWGLRVEDLVFVGLDTVEHFLALDSQLDKVRSESDGGAAIILMSHRWPESYERKRVGESLKTFANGRNVLFLHGHVHPRGFTGLLWDPSAPVGDLNCYRSNVYSGFNRRRGIGHHITWQGNQFHCSEVRGDC